MNGKTNSKLQDVFQLPEGQKFSSFGGAGGDEFYFANYTNTNKHNRRLPKILIPE